MQEAEFDKYFVRIAQQSADNKYADAVESYLKEMDFIRAISRKGEQVFDL